MLEAKKLVIKIAIFGMHLPECKTMDAQLQSTDGTCCSKRCLHNDQTILSNTILTTNL